MASKYAPFEHISEFIPDTQHLYTFWPHLQQILSGVFEHRKELSQQCCLAVASSSVQDQISREHSPLCGWFDIDYLQAIPFTLSPVSFVIAVEKHAAVNSSE